MSEENVREAALKAHLLARRLSKERAEILGEAVAKSWPKLGVWDLAWVIAAGFELRGGRCGPCLALDLDRRPGRPVEYGRPALGGRPGAAHNEISQKLMEARRKARYSRECLEAITGVDVTAWERSPRAPLVLLGEAGERVRRVLHLREKDLCDAELRTAQEVGPVQLLLDLGLEDPEVLK